MKAKLERNIQHFSFMRWKEALSTRVSSPFNMVSSPFNKGFKPFRLAPPCRMVKHVFVAQVVEHEEDAERQPEQARHAQRAPVPTGERGGGVRIGGVRGGGARGCRVAA